MCFGALISLLAYAMAGFYGVQFLVYVVGYLVLVVFCWLLTVRDALEPAMERRRKNQAAFEATVKAGLKAHSETSCQVPLPGPAPSGRPPSQTPSSPG